MITRSIFWGIDAEETNQRVLDCFEAAKEKHLSLLHGTEGEMAQAVRRFFVRWNPEKASGCEAVKEKWEDITDGGNLIFCMGINYAQDDPFIQKAWEEARNASSEEGQTGICLVTGKEAQISRIHKTIKGVPGAQSQRRCTCFIQCAGF